MSWTQPLDLLIWVVWGAFGISIIAATLSGIRILGRLMWEHRRKLSMRERM